VSQTKVTSISERDSKWLIVWTSRLNFLILMKVATSISASRNWTQ
jgi:hypothetical protein